MERHSKIKPRGLMNDNENSLEALDFKAKSEDEVIKVPKCTYANDIKVQTTFYFCQCSPEDFYPICSACAETCHKSHKPALKLVGTYTCNCGKANHLITRDNERRFNDKKIKLQNQCIFGKFFEVTPNRGYFQLNSVILCAVCVEYCYQKSFNEEDLEHCQENTLTCQCERHYEMNVINLNVDLISKPKFHFNLQNFNYNILSKVTVAKQMYIDYLVNKISAFMSSPTSEQSKNFFSNFINFKILELFSAFAVKWENKFFHVKNYLGSFSYENLIKLMSFNEPVSMLTPNDAGDFASAKFYFAEMIFNYIIRTYQLRYNNLWNIRTIINMNLYQRFIYLQEIRNFFKFNFFDNDNVFSCESLFNEMSNAVLELYDTILKVNENFDFTDRIMSYIFPTFNRIFKYLIKYNIINDEVKAKYFELVLDTITLANDKGKNTESYSGNEFYIVKSILYSLIYRNDRICINYIRDQKDPQHKKFVFQFNPESDNTCKIFVQVLDKFNRTEDLNRTIVFDFYVRKIFELMIGSNEFYIKSLTNLQHIPEHELLMITSSEVHYDARQYINQPYLREIVTFCTKLNLANRDYFDYNLNYESYLNQVNDVFKELKQFIYTNISFLPELSKKYQIFLDQAALDENTNRKVADIQNCVKYSLFFQKVEEFLHIYSEGKRFKWEDDSPKIALNVSQNEHLEILLHFIYLLVLKNYPNLCLIMNIKSKIFVTTFMDIPEKLFEFLERICEMVYSNNDYVFDNLYFISECLKEIVDRVELHQENREFNLYVLLQSMKIIKKTIGYINMNSPDFLNAIEAINTQIKKIKEDQSLIGLLTEYFFNDSKVEIKRIKDAPLTVIEKFLVSYFEYCNELIYHDFYFFGIIKDSDFLYDIDTVEFIIQEIHKSSYSVTCPFEIEYEMTRFILLLRVSFELKISSSDKYMKNLFMKNIPKITKNVYLTHLSKNPDSPELNKNNVEVLIDRSKILLEFNKSFQRKFKQIMNYYTQDVLQRKIALLKFLEHLLLRPTFTMLNVFILNANYLKGNDCFVVYQLCFYFLKNIVYFYENIHHCNGGDEDNLTRLLHKEEVLDYEGIVVRSELDLNIVNEIYEDSLKLSQNEIKYFELDKVYDLYLNALYKILKLKEKPVTMIKSNITDRSGDRSDRIERKPTSIKTKTKNVKKPNYVIRMEKLITKYKDNVNSTYDNNLSLIKILETTDSEIDLGTSMYNYLISKLADDLTDYNFNNKDYAMTYSPGKIKQLDDINKFKFQNSYVIIYLNALFYHDSSRFQEILSENLHEDYDTFFTFMTKSLIFPVTLNETRKIYEIDSLIYDYDTKLSYLSKRKSLSYEIAMLSIKFLQNLCENHNQDFQDRFFGFRYNVDKVDYLYKDFIKKENEDNAKTRLSQKRLLNVANLTTALKKEITNIQGNLPRANNTTNNILVRPHLSGAEMEKLTGLQRDYIEKKREKEKEESKALDQNETSFLNFIQNIMRVLLTHLNVESSFKGKLLSQNKEIKNFENVTDIYKRYTDLVIEMIQGTSSRNFDHFYRKLPDSLQIFDETGELYNPSTLESFIFIKNCIEIESLLNDPSSTFDIISLQMKCDMFTTINNVINQEITDISFIKILIVIFPPEKLINLISKYVRGLIIKHIRNIDYEDKDFIESFEYLELDNRIYKSLKYRFKNDMDIYEDDFFKLAAQMYLFLTILGEKYHILDAEKVLRLDEKEVISNQTENEQGGQLGTLQIGKPKFYMKFVNFFKRKIFNHKKVVDLINANELNLTTSIQQVKRVKPQNNINNLIISAKFLSKTIKNCEFMIDSSNDDEVALKLKLIYFIIDPRVYLISKNNQETFFDEVDRSSSTTKLKSLIDRLNFFMWEVDYKYSHLKRSKHLKWMLEVDYKNVDFLNFCISLLINFLLLIFLTGEQLKGGNIYYITVGLAAVQILINIIYLIIFLMSKYKFYVLLQKSEFDKQQGLGLVNWLKVYILDSFLINDEIYLMILNIIIGCIGILSSYGSFLFSLQLLTVIKFVPTIKEIVIAFKLRLSQLISMIGFLAILIFFYSNIGFYFLYNEFEVVIDDNKENLCATLLECAITYFNHGVRSGGGIGDVLNPVSFNDSSTFWVRWVTDMIFYITVILLLLNMINGVIVSTFSQIREESNEKEEDINNKCFICNIDRVEFEKRKIAFADHQKYEHNVKTFIRFLIYLKLINPKDLDSDQSFIVECIKNRDISCFPVLRSSSVGALDVQDEDEEDNDE